MVRLNMPKHQKNSKKRGMMGMSNQLSGITHFSDITALTGGDGQVSERETSLGGLGRSVRLHLGLHKNGHY